MRWEKSEDEVLLGEEDPADEAMGPQILIEFHHEDLGPKESEVTAVDLLEFTSPYLTIYGIPLMQESSSI